MEHLTVISGSGETFELALPVQEEIDRIAAGFRETITLPRAHFRERVIARLQEYFPVSYRSPLERISVSDAFKLASALMALAGTEAPFSPAPGRLSLSAFPANLSCTVSSTSPHDKLPGAGDFFHIPASFPFEKKEMSFSLRQPAEMMFPDVIAEKIPSQQLAAKTLPTQIQLSVVPREFSEYSLFSAECPGEPAHFSETFVFSTGYQQQNHFPLFQSGHEPLSVFLQTTGQKTTFFSVAPFSNSLRLPFEWAAPWQILNTSAKIPLQTVSAHHRTPAHATVSVRSDRENMSNASFLQKRSPELKDPADTFSVSLPELQGKSVPELRREYFFQFPEQPISEAETYFFTSTPRTLSAIPQDTVSVTQSLPDTPLFATIGIPQNILRDQLPEKAFSVTHTPPENTFSVSENQRLNVFSTGHTTADSCFAVTHTPPENTFSVCESQRLNVFSAGQAQRGNNGTFPASAPGNDTASFSQEVILAAFHFKWSLEYAASLPPELLLRCLETALAAANGVTFPRQISPMPEWTPEEIRQAARRGAEALERFKKG